MSGGINDRLLKRTTEYTPGLPTSKDSHYVKVSNAHHRKKLFFFFLCSNGVRAERTPMEERRKKYGMGGGLDRKMIVNFPDLIELSSSQHI